MEGQTLILMRNIHSTMLLTLSEYQVKAITSYTFLWINILLLKLLTINMLCSYVLRLRGMYTLVDRPFFSIVPA